jgi:hypothetical protein
VTAPTEVGTGPHNCPGPGRHEPDRPVPEHMLACGRHWYQVDGPTRTAVWAAWDEGRGRGTSQHRRAIAAAIAQMHE